MKKHTITINVSDEQYNNLKDIAKGLGTTPGEILSEFIACLNWDGNGSDERQLANDWLNRERCNYGGFDYD